MHNKPSSPGGPILFLKCTIHYHQYLILLQCESNVKMMTMILDLFKSFTVDCVGFAFFGGGLVGDTLPPFLFHYFPFRFAGPKRTTYAKTHTYHCCMYCACPLFFPYFSSAHLARNRAITPQQKGEKCPNKNSQGCHFCKSKPNREREGHTHNSFHNFSRTSHHPFFILISCFLFWYYIVMLLQSQLHCSSLHCANCLVFIFLEKGCF